jgi:hypothetical protein
MYAVFGRLLKWLLVRYSGKELGFIMRRPGRFPLPDNGREVSGTGD